MISLKHILYGKGACPATRRFTTRHIMLCWHRAWVAMESILELTKAFLVSFFITQIIYVFYPRLGGLWFIISTVSLLGALAGCIFEGILTLSKNPSRR